MNVLKRSLGLLRITELPGDHNLPIVGVLTVAKRSICGKVLREKVNKPAPFPYETKKFFPYIHGIFDDCRDRFDENSAIIFVEGMPSAGKSKLAAGLAEELEMKYYPAVSMDSVYKLPNGEDYRNHKNELPGNIYPWDTSEASTFLYSIEEWPRAHMVGPADRKCQPITNHQSSQGVVLEQNPYSDVAFTEAMIDCGYLSKKVQEWYKALILSTHAEILHPHLVVYLDVPLEETEKRLAAKHGGLPSALNRKFLETLDSKYRHSYLPSIGQYSELLVYDWTEVGDEEVVVEDIERINFDRNLDPESLMFSDWRKLEFKSQWNELRYRFGTAPHQLENLFSIPTHRVPELFVSEEESITKDLVYRKMIGDDYAPGFNPKMGDSVLFKI